jgi:hypothetical protein
MREPKLQISFWGMKVDAQGALGILAALLIFLAVLVAWRF